VYGEVFVVGQDLVADRTYFESDAFVLVLLHEFGRENDSYSVPHSARVGDSPFAEQAEQQVDIVHLLEFDVAVLLPHVELGRERLHWDVGSRVTLVFGFELLTQVDELLQQFLVVQTDWMILLRYHVPSNNAAFIHIMFRWQPHILSIEDSNKLVDVVLNLFAAQHFDCANDKIYSKSFVRLLKLVGHLTPETNDFLEGHWDFSPIFQFEAGTRGYSNHQLIHSIVELTFERVPNPLLQDVFQFKNVSCGSEFVVEIGPSCFTASLPTQFYIRKGCGDIEEFLEEGIFVVEFSEFVIEFRRHNLVEDLQSEIFGSKQILGFKFFVGVEVPLYGSVTVVIFCAVLVLCLEHRLAQDEVTRGLRYQIEEEGRRVDQHRGVHMEVCEFRQFLEERVKQTRFIWTGLQSVNEI